MKNIILFNLLLLISTTTLCQESQNIESQNNNTENSIENEVSDLTYLLNLNEVQILQITDIVSGINIKNAQVSTMNLVQEDINEMLESNAAAKSIMILKILNENQKVIYLESLN
jgi:hypothetical protein